MINGIAGTIFFLLAIGLAVWLVRKVVDLVIGLAVLAGIVLIFSAGSEMSLGGTIGIALFLGVAISVISIPLWPLSDSFMRDVILDKTSGKDEPLKTVAKTHNEMLSGIVRLSSRDSLRILRIENELNLPSMTLEELEQEAREDKETRHIEQENDCTDQIYE